MAPNNDRLWDFLIKTNPKDITFLYVKETLHTISPTVKQKIKLRFQNIFFLLGSGFDRLITEPREKCCYFKFVILHSCTCCKQSKNPTIAWSNLYKIHQS